MSVARLLTELPGGLQRQQLRGAQLHRHVGQLERHALELADLLPELRAVDRPLLGELERPLGAPEAVGRDLQARGAQPGVGNLEALVDLAQHRRLRQPAVGESQDAVGVAAVRDILVSGQHLEPGRALVDQERRHEPPLAARRTLLARDGEQDGEVGVIGVTDEVLGAVDHEVTALEHRAGLHAAQVGARLRLRHGEAFDALAAHRRQ